MITLIPKTNQEAFDSVWNQLKTQTKRANDGVQCVYRGNGDKHSPIRCAIGGMIPDNQYIPSIEGTAISGLTRENTGVIRTTCSVRLLTLLQTVHDRLDNWSISYALQETFTGWDELRTIAYEFDLAIPE